MILTCALVLLILTGDLSNIEAQTTDAASASHRLKHGFRNLDRSYSYTMLGRAGRLVARLGQWSRPPRQASRARAE